MRPDIGSLIAVMSRDMGLLSAGGMVLPEVGLSVS